MKNSSKLTIATPLKKLNGKVGKTEKLAKAPGATVLKPKMTMKKMPQRKANSRMSGVELLKKAFKGR